MLSFVLGSLQLDQCSVWCGDRSTGNNSFPRVRCVQQWSSKHCLVRVGFLVRQDPPPVARISSHEQLSTKPSRKAWPARRHQLGGVSHSWCDWLVARKIRDHPTTPVQITPPQMGPLPSCHQFYVPCRHYLRSKACWWTPAKILRQCRRHSERVELGCAAAHLPFVCAPRSTVTQSYHEQHRTYGTASMAR